MTMFGFRLRGNPISMFGVCVLGIGLSGCALSPFDDDGVVRATTRSVGLSPNPVQAPGFVQQTRPDELKYVPVGVTPPPRVPLGNPKTLEAELAAKRAQNEAAAASQRPPSPYEGRIEPGYKPPKPAPIPDSGPPLTVPRAAGANAPSTGDKPATTLRRSIRARPATPAATTPAQKVE